MAGKQRFIVRDSDGKVHFRSSEGLLTADGKAEAQAHADSLTAQFTGEDGKASETFTVEQYLPQ